MIQSAVWLLIEGPKVSALCPLINPVPISQNYTNNINNDYNNNSNNNNTTTNANNTNNNNMYYYYYYLAIKACTIHFCHGQQRPLTHKACMDINNGPAFHIMLSAVRYKHIDLLT